MNIKIVSYQESEDAIRFVRDTVFGEEQMVARELDWDGKDPHCVHVVATDDDGSPIGTGRMQVDGKIGRLAVLDSLRGRGVGREMLEALVESARIRSLEKVYLHAQIHAIPFYEKSHFQKTGEEFVEAGIRHINMIRNTQPGSQYDT